MVDEVEYARALRAPRRSSAVPGQVRRRYVEVVAVEAVGAGSKVTVRRKNGSSTYDCRRYPFYNAPVVGEWIWVDFVSGTDPQALGPLA